jgi:hypothetical protein
LTVSGEALGTAEYTSPEQLSNSHDVDLRTDVYSLGCTFYKLLTGQAPFDSPQYPSRDNKLSAHLLKTVPDVRTLRTEIPGELAELLVRMTAKSPTARIASMGEVAQRVTQFCAGHDLPALVKRAADGPAETAPAARTDEFRSSAAISTDGFKHGQGVQPLQELARPEIKGNKKWTRYLLLAGLALAALFFGAIVGIATDRGTLEIVTLDDDVRVVVAQNGRDVSIIDTVSDKEIKLHSGEYQLRLDDGPKGFTLSANQVTLKRGDRQVVRVIHRPATTGSGPKTIQPEGTALLDDFLKGVPGRWVPVLTSETDVAKFANGMGTESVASLLSSGVISYRDGALVLTEWILHIPGFRHSVQGIRAKVKVRGGVLRLYVRDRGGEGAYIACFEPGRFGIKALNYSNSPQNPKLSNYLFSDYLTQRQWQANWKEEFVPIGLAAIGDRVCCEVAGQAALELRDGRVRTGSPTFGVKSGGPAIFKDIEVFVPDKDFYPQSGATPAVGAGK